MFFKRILRARRRRKRHARVRSGSGAKVNTLGIQHASMGDTSRRWGNSARMADYNGNSNVSRIAGDGKSRAGSIYTLETNLLRSDLVSPDRRFHSFTPFVDNARTCFFASIVAPGIYARFRYSAHPSFNFANSVADL